jgi:CMP-N-acetylneuraminic acid synthetase
LRYFVVFCSDAAIQDYLITGVNFLKRPKYLDALSATPQNIISEFISLIDADIYMVAHTTSPFVNIEHLEECVEAAASNNAQDLKSIYVAVFAAYIFRKEVFLNSNRRIRNCVV